MTMELKSTKKGIFTLIDLVEHEGKSYGLLCLQFGKAVRFALYIEDGERYDLVLIGDQRRNAQTLFSMAVRGGLSPLHLREIALDRTQEEMTEIFF